MEYATPTWRAGRQGGALELDGVANWVKVSSSTSLGRIASGLTLAAWVQRKDNPAAWSNVVSRQAGTSGAEHYGLAFDKGLPALVIASGEAGSHKCNGSTVAPTGTWLHLAATWDGATGRLYVNGAEVCTLPRMLTLRADTTPLVIGGNANDANDDAQELFGGLLDDLVVYSRALTPAEVAALAR
jgi:hypothetical protein